MDKMYLKQLYIHVSVQQKYTTTTEIRNQNDINVTYLQNINVRIQLAKDCKQKWDYIIWFYTSLFSFCKH